MLGAKMGTLWRWNPFRSRVRNSGGKVPEVTICFWIIKVLITGANVWAPDYLIRHFGTMIVAGLGGVVLVAVLALQFSVRRYSAWVYWLAVAAVSVAGTMAGNGLHAEFGVPYSICAACYLVVLVAILVTWRASEKTLSLRSIDTPQREAFYWAAVLSAFALGGAVGHLTATAAFSLGSSPPAHLISFATLTAVLTLAWWRFGMNPVLAFWSAYVVTRPLGAGLAIWLAAPNSAGGLGMGPWSVSLGLTIVVISLVAYLAATRNDIQEPAATGLPE